MKDVSVPPERLQPWLQGFAERHGPTSYHATGDVVTVTAADGARAECLVPFPPLAVDDAQPYGGLLAHAGRNRRVGVILVRRGGYAAGVFEGRALVASKVGARHVQGRTAAGGQSQQRFARRREKQAREAFEAAADVAARVVAPEAGRIDAVVLGGDKAALTRVMADPRLSPLRDLVVEGHLAVPDPKLAVLRNTPRQFRSVRIRLSEPLESDT
ncbi:MAG TPA: acVLRF1 family peptidyl-tRNA hydrolase [Jiangellaceae bacterium]|nr:acVLRF1 family peptidyl-tRNA hydrolase [Jiangellaceae bacterium]